MMTMWKSVRARDRNERSGGEDRRHKFVRAAHETGDDSVPVQRQHKIWCWAVRLLHSRRRLRRALAKKAESCGNQGRRLAVGFVVGGYLGLNNVSAGLSGAPTKETAQEETPVVQSGLGGFLRDFVLPVAGTVGMVGATAALPVLAIPFTVGMVGIHKVLDSRQVPRVLSEYDAISERAVAGAKRLGGVDAAVSKTPRCCRCGKVLAWLCDGEILNETCQCSALLVDTDRELLGWEHPVIPQGLARWARALRERNGPVPVYGHRSGRLGSEQPRMAWNVDYCQAGSRVCLQCTSAE